MRKQILGLFLLLLAGVLYAGEVEVPRLSPLPERSAPALSFAGTGDGGTSTAVRAVVV